MPIFAYLAAVLAGIGYIEDASQAHVSPWLSPGALTLAAIALLVLHLAGIGSKRP